MISNSRLGRETRGAKPQELYMSGQQRVLLGSLFREVA
jgi:hypothetical protein